MSVYFGRDTSCTSSLRTGRFVEGNRLLAEALYRRLITPRGKLRGGDDEASYGLDLPGKIGKAVTASSRAALEDQIRAECEKDERVLSTEATITEKKAANGSVSWRVQVEVESGNGPFTFQVGVKDVTPEFLGYAEAA